MSTSRYIELSFLLLVAFVILATISFLTLRPTLTEIRNEAQNEWTSFLRQVQDRNYLVPGLVEAFKAVEPGHGRLVEKLLEARAVSSRSTDAATTVASVDEIERCLMRIQELVELRPELMKYPPFEAHWNKTGKISRGVADMRNAYNCSARLYNRLLTPFPQNLLTGVLGFVPLKEYPAGGSSGNAY